MYYTSIIGRITHNFIILLLLCVCALNNKYGKPAADLELTRIYYDLRALSPVVDGKLIN